MSTKSPGLDRLTNRFSHFFQGSVAVDLFVLALLPACDVAREQSRVAEELEIGIASQSGFRAPPREQLTRHDAELEIQSELPVDSRGVRWTFMTPAGIEASFWDVELILSEDVQKRQSQIDSLSRSFGRVSSRGSQTVSPHLTTYFLSDFLPAKMQALQGYAFVKLSEVKWGLLGSSSLERDPVVDNFVLRPELRKVSNCWTTAYELLRPDSLRFEAWFSSDRHVLHYLDSVDDVTGEVENRDTDWTTFVKELHWSEACVPSSRRSCPQGNLVNARNDDLKFGDLLLISTEQGIAHAALYLGRDLYFEKTGATKEHELYRIVPFDQIASVYGDPRLRFRYRRLVEERALPDPVDAFFATWNGFEEEVWELMADSLKDRGARPAWQPEVGDSRDLGIYLPEERSILFDQKGRARLQEP